MIPAVFAARNRSPKARDRGTFVRPTKVTLGAFLLDEWLPAKRSGLRPSTVNSYERLISLYVVPTLGEVALSDIDGAMLNALYARLLEPNMVLLADRGFTGYALWKQASATGADLIWRAKNNVKPRHIETFDDGSWLGELRANNAKLSTEHVVVRVVDYDIDDGRDTPTGPFRLFTTMVDPDEVTATELATAYGQRWEIESVFDELKTHQRGSKMVLRSKSPALVEQEIWGHLCCHYAIRTLMLAAANDVAVDPDRVSFVAALRIIRRSLSQARGFSPSGH